MKSLVIMFTLFLLISCLAGTGMALILILYPEMNASMPNGSPRWVAGFIILVCGSFVATELAIKFRSIVES